MILIYVRNLLYFFCLCAAVWSAPFLLSAQSSVSITVAPTLIELNMKPGEVWRSNLKVVNTNPFPLTIATTPAHFTPAGERGQGSLVPENEVPDDEPLLVNWVTIESPEVRIAPGQSVQIPFIINAPADAVAGSHYAALQVSTVPPQTVQQVGLQTSQVISSLLFVRIAGDITEAGQIRSFSTTHSWGTEPHTDISLRFENTGNVHVRPVGEILIRNVWGTERGRIPVNFNTSFGNALPGTVREYQFSWSKEPSLLDIGYYTAEVSLAYGTEVRQFATSKSGFWVVPVRPLLVLCAVIFGIILFIVMVSRWYISQLLARAGVQSLDALQQSRTPAMVIRRGDDLNLAVTSKAAVGQARKPNLLHIIQAYVQNALDHSTRWLETLQSIWTVMSGRARHIALGVAGLLLVLLILTVVTAKRNYDPGYQSTVGGAEQSVTYNAEEIAFFQQPGMNPGRLAAEAPYQVVLINTTQDVGAAGRLAATLIAEFPISALVADAPAERSRTVVVFPTALQAEAVRLSEALNGALPSATSENTTTISVYLGDDRVW
jgi:hypothetical protein